MNNKQDYRIKNDSVISVLSFLAFIIFSVIILYTNYFSSIQYIDFLFLVGFLSPVFILNEIFYRHQIEGSHVIKSKIFLKFIDSVKGFCLIFPFLFLFLLYKYFQIHWVALTVLLLVISSISLRFYFQSLRKVIRNELILFFIFLIPLVLFIKYSISL